MEYFKDCMTHEQLDVAHRQWVKKLHPDLNPDNPNATAEFQEMQAQYEERKAELNGDYTKARKGRERREREERERQERERKERERRKVEQVVEQARLNRQKSHAELKVGDYIYARQVEFTRSMFDWDYLAPYELLHIIAKNGVKEERVVVIEAIFDVADRFFFEMKMSEKIQFTGEIYGGYEVLQTADPASGIRRGKHVAKVVMFRSEHYCAFGNPKGDNVISDYYVSPAYETMFAYRLQVIRADILRQEQEKAAEEAARKAKLLAEQQPLIDEWSEKLIAMSAGLDEKERKTVAMNNLRTMLKSKFPGTRFNVKTDRYELTSVKWEDGPTMDEVLKVMELFDVFFKEHHLETTPWIERYGGLSFSIADFSRKISAITKAKILQQLGQVTGTFCNVGMYDEVPMTDFEWMMLHLLVGIDINVPDSKLCGCTMTADGSRTVRPIQAVNFVFSNTNYCRKIKHEK